MLKYAFLMLAGASLAVPAAAQTTTAQPQTGTAQITTVQSQPATQVATAKSDVNKLICKREEQIGSRLGAKKVCLTQKQWTDRAEFDREQTERIQQNTGTRPSG